MKTTPKANIQISHELKTLAFSDSVNPKIFKDQTPTIYKGKKYTKGEVLRAELDSVYFLITGKKLSQGCSDCIPTALKIVHNYCKFYLRQEPQGEKVKTKIKTVQVLKETKKEDQGDQFNEDNFRESLADMTLKELRALYPGIKATSTAKFIDLLIESEKANA